MKKQIYAIVSLIFINLIFYSCTEEKQKDEITIQELIPEIENNSSLVILDVRTKAELTGPLGKIDNAIHIPIDELESRLDKLEEYKDKDICVICRAGVRSARGTKILNKNGFNARNILGGMQAFRNNYW